MSTSEPERAAPPRWLLPRQAYLSQEWFDREQRLLFSRCWAFAGMSDEVPDVGDYLCTTVGGHPIVVLRSPDGELRAFHNLCRHRGVQLLEGRGNVRRGISCFYHRWRYELDGSLRSVPQPDQFPDLCKGDLGLHPAGLGTWNGFVFVHVDAEPHEPLDDWLGDVRDRLGPFRPLELEPVRPVRREVRANWKLFIENHIDGYHLWHLHARSIRGLDHAAQAWQPTGRHWTFYEPESERGTHADAALTGLPVLPSHGPGGFGSSVHLVFPNLGIAGGSTFFATLHAIPLAPDRTLVEMRTRIAPMGATAQARVAIDLGVRKARKALAGSALAGPARTVGLLPRGEPSSGDDGDFVAEDIMAAEAAQRGMGSGRFSVGPMATDYESSITAFQRNILDHLGDDGAPDGTPRVGGTRTDAAPPV